MNGTKQDLNKYGLAILNSANGFVMRGQDEVGAGMMAWNLMVSPGNKTVKGIVKFGNSKFSLNINFSMMFSSISLYGVPITELARVDDRGDSALREIKRQVPEGHQLPREVVSVIRGVYGALDTVFKG